MNRRIDEYYFANQLLPHQMDYLWAQGWRHFGVFFFRYSTVQRSNGLYHVTPLRVDLARFTLSTSQKRALKKNQDLQVEIRPAFIDDGKEALFQRHKTRFIENVPNSLYDFLAPEPAETPCETKEVCLLQDGQLIAVSFLDIGAQATSSIYSIFEPAESKRSLGIYLILLSIAYSMQHGKEYYYPGYAYAEPSFYDYKKRLRGLEQYDWEEWRPVVCCP
ncbi:MAG: arginine-tRNA-protein transferase [Blastocatellia bacterium]